MPLDLTQTLYWAALVAPPFITGYLAYRKGVNPYLWFGLGLIFGILPLLALFLMPNKQLSHLSSQPTVPKKPHLTGPQDKFWYYIDNKKTQQGPISFQALQKGFERGSITKKSYVWHEDLSEWTQLEHFVQISEPIDNQTKYSAHLNK